MSNRGIGTFWFIVLLLTTLANGDMSLILDTRKSNSGIDKSKAVMERAMGDDAALASLVKKKNLKVSVKKVGGEYFLITSPLPSDDETAALYWKLHQIFPSLVSVNVDRKQSKTQEGAESSRVSVSSQGSEEEIMLWLALFAMALTGILGLYFSSRQIQKLQEGHARILKHHEEIEQRISELFSRLGEDICQIGKEAVSYTSLLMERAPQPELGSDLKRVVSMESRIVDSATNLLGFLKLKAKKVVVRNENFNLNNMLDDVVENLKSNITKTETELIFEMDRSLPRYVVGDFFHIGEILSKLLEHAILFNAGRETKLQMSAYRPYVGGMDLQMRIYYPPLENEEEGENFFIPHYDESQGEYRRLGLFVAYELTDLLGGTVNMYRHSRRSEVLIDLSIPVRQSDEKEQRKYHLPEKRYIRKDVVIVNRSYEASIALKRMFSYFRHRVTVFELESFEKRQPPLERYDLLLIEDELLDEITCKNIRKVKENSALKVVALHNVFRPTPSLPAKDIVDTQVNKPMNLQRVFSLILELYGAKENTVSTIPAEEEKEKPRNFIWEYAEKPGIKLEDFSEFSGSTIMVVEDNPLNMRMLLKILENSGIRIVQAENGQEAVKKMEKASPGEIDLILMDINMPIMDGYRATMGIRKLPDGKKLPIVALSALNIDNELDRMRRAEMDGYIPKPLNLGRLYTLFDKYLKKQKRVKPDLNRKAHHLRPDCIDWEIALSHANGNELLLQEVLESYVEAYGRSDEQLSELFAFRNYKEMRKMLLDLMGLTGSIGAEKLHEITKDLYRAIILHKMEDAERLIEEYRRESGRLVSSLRKYLSEA